MRELQTNNNVAICLPSVMALIKSMQEKFDKILSNTEYQGAILLHPHFRFSLMSNADNQVFQFSSESTREKIKTKLIGLVKSLLNRKDLRATNSCHEAKEAAKQDGFFVQTIERWKTERS